MLETCDGRQIDRQVDIQTTNQKCLKMYTVIYTDRQTGRHNPRVEKWRSYISGFDI